MKVYQVETSSRKISGAAVPAKPRFSLGWVTRPEVLYEMLKQKLSSTIGGKIKGTIIQNNLLGSNYEKLGIFY